MSQLLHTELLPILSCTILLIRTLFQNHLGFLPLSKPNTLCGYIMAESLPNFFYPPLCPYQSRQWKVNVDILSIRNLDTRQSVPAAAHDVISYFGIQIMFHVDRVNLQETSIDYKAACNY